MVLRRRHGQTRSTTPAHTWLEDTTASRAKWRGVRSRTKILVNWPNWLCLNVRPEDGDWFDLRQVEILDYRQELDLKRGLLRRFVRYRDREGRETTLGSRRLVHMGDPHLAAIELTVEAENWSGRLEIASALDGRVVNNGVVRYRALRGDHLEPRGTHALGKRA